MCVQLFDTVDCSLPGSSVYWNFPGKKTGVGCHFLLQEIFPTQGSNPNLLHWQADPSPLSHQESSQICMYSFGCTGLQHEGYLDVAMWDSFPPPGIEPGPPTLGAQKLTLWTTREDPTQLSVQFSSVTQLCPTLCDPMDCSLPGIPSMGFSRQEYWNGLPFPSPGGLPDPGIKPGSPTLQADALLAEPLEKNVK